MGYTTDFSGEVSVTPPLNEAERTFLTKFAETRRMDRSGGPYFVDGTGSFGQGDGPDTVHNHNAPPEGQPGLWCQWIPTSDDGSVIGWDGGEKFYDSEEWMTYIIDHFLKERAVAMFQGDGDQFREFTFNHVVNGVIEAQGEEVGDHWFLVVENNVVTSMSAQDYYTRPVVN